MPALAWERRAPYGRTRGTRWPNDRPPCWCCATIRQHIAVHYDPHETVEAVDDPGARVRAWGCDLTPEEVARYLSVLPTAGN